MEAKTAIMDAKCSPILIPIRILNLRILNLRILNLTDRAAMCRAGERARLGASRHGKRWCKMALI